MVVQHSKMAVKRQRVLERQVKDLQRSNQAYRTLTKSLLSGKGFDVGTLLDVRDHVGMWLKARIDKTSVVRVPGGAGGVFVHYLDWDSRWDEWILPEKDSFRFAAAGYYTTAGETKAQFPVGGEVEVFVTRPLPRCWRLAVVKKIHQLQIKVEYFAENGRRHEYWFHSKSGEIRAVSEKETLQLGLKDSAFASSAEEGSKRRE
jgi:hypothetical protein